MRLRPDPVATTKPLSAAALRKSACEEKRGAALSATAVKLQLTVLDQWHLTKGALQRTFTFANYYETMAFVNAIAWISHREDHHPDLAVAYDHCTVRYSTHSVKGISMNDFICAAKCDATLGLTVPHGT
jgi:4a-hydroxytetrahydrobiopterin dehydratase